MDVKSNARRYVLETAKRFLNTGCLFSERWRLLSMGKRSHGHFTLSAKNTCFNFTALAHISQSAFEERECDEQFGKRSGLRLSHSTACSRPASFIAFAVACGPRSLLARRILRSSPHRSALVMNTLKCDNG